MRDEEVEHIPHLPVEIMLDLPTENGKRRRLTANQPDPERKPPETPQAPVPTDADEFMKTAGKNKQKQKPQAARAASAPRTSGSARVPKVRR